MTISVGDAVVRTAVARARTDALLHAQERGQIVPLTVVRLFEHEGVLYAACKAPKAADLPGNRMWDPVVAVTDLEPYERVTEETVF